MPIGSPRNFHKKFKYLVEIDGFVSFAFQTCSALEAEVATVEQWEGGALQADKSPGRATVSDITLERGVTDDLDAWNWFKEVLNMSAGTGVVTPNHIRGVEIVQLDRDASELRRWALIGPWPKKFVAGDWDGTADENVVETLVLSIDGFDPVSV
ncbi:MAG: phage tail protein [Gemmatimonadota bacterium]